MTAPYRRPPGAAQADYAAAKKLEEEVADKFRAVGPLVTNLDSTTRLDYWRPGWYADLKEKKQKLTDRWHLLPGVEEKDLMVLDELAIRKCMEHWPHAFLLLHDCPEDRWFLAPVHELVCFERARRDRNNKAKLIYRLTDFRQVDGPVHAEQTFMTDLQEFPWKHGKPVGHTVPAQV